MRNTLLIASSAIGVLTMLTTPASAFLSNQGHIAAAQEVQDNVVMVKRSKAKPRPPGWSRGKATWKRTGRGVPPGQRR
jgi:hypothetical protein